MASPKLKFGDKVTHKKYGHGVIAGSNAGDILGKLIMFKDNINWEYLHKLNPADLKRGWK